MTTSRQYYINGESLVSVTLAGGALQELGLSDSPITVREKLHHLDLHVDAFGDSTPNVQFMGAEALVDMTLIHFVPATLAALIAASMASPTEGVLPRAGTLMGQDANGNGQTFFFGLTISSPVQNSPFVYPSVYMPDTPRIIPLGAERSIVQVTFRAIPYAADPASAASAVVWHH